MTFIEAARRRIEDILRRENPVPQGNPLRPKLIPFGSQRPRSAA